MRPSRAVFALPLAFVAFGACSSSDTGVHVGVSPNIVFPEGLLDSVSKLTLQVFDSGPVSCDTTKGSLKGSSSPIATKDLASSGCPASAKFCGDVQVDKSDTARVFLAQAYTAGNSTPIASGCTQATVNQDTLQVQIKMLRFVPPATCGGQPSKLPAVQCDPPGDAADTVCDPTCQTKELFLSVGDAATTSSAKVKTRPSFVWPAGTGPAGRFVAFFGDKSPSTRTQVSMRVMGDDLHTTGDLGVGVQTQSYFMPNNPSGTPFPPVGEAGSQNNPSAVFLNGQYYVAFDNNAAGPSAINLRTLPTPVKSTQGPGAPAKVSDPGAPMLQPSMAASGDGKLFVAWQSNGSILGRTVDANSLALGTQQTLGTGQNVVVAGMPTGWVIAYESGADVKMQLVDGTGAGKGEQKVNDATHSGNQQHPGVAALTDGRFAVDWIDTGAQGGAGVFVQRYDATGKAVAGDQTLRINTNTGDQSNTAIGGSAASGGFFAAAWVDTTTGHVRARLLGGSSGFAFNSVTAQNDDFQVSQADGRTRSNPVVAVGGSGPFLVIGWQDDTTGLVDPNFPGIWARRFPMP